MAVVILGIGDRLIEGSIFILWRRELGGARPRGNSAAGPYAAQR